MYIYMARLDACKTAGTKKNTCEKLRMYCTLCDTFVGERNKIEYRDGQNGTQLQFEDVVSTAAACRSFALAALRSS